MNILERIDFAFNKKLISEAGPMKEKGEPGEVIDMTDQTARMYGLSNCRGPNIGWDDYAAGRDYQPPMHFEAGSNVEIGPKDTGKDGVLVPGDYKEVKFIGPNPYSVNHGGIRPWSKGEIIATLIYDGDDEEGEGGPNGLLRMLAKQKGRITKASEAMAGKEERDENDIRDSVMLGAMAVLQMLPKDENRPGTRFTAFVGNWIEQAMFAGTPPGYSDEYRRTKGLRSRVEPAVKNAILAARQGKPMDEVLRDVQDKFNELYRCPACKGTGTVASLKKEPVLDANGNDTGLKKVVKTKNGKTIPENQPCEKCGGKGTTKHIEKGPHHPFGNLLPELEKVRNKVIRAITSGSPKAIEAAYKNMEDEFDRIKLEGEIFSSGGITTTGSVGKKAREHGALNTYNRASKLLNKQRELAEKAIKELQEGNAEELDKLANEAGRQWKAFKTPKHKKWVPDPNVAPEDQKEPVYVSPYEKPQKTLHGSRGSIGLAAITTELIRALQSKNEEQIRKFITMSQDEERLIRDREQVKLQSSKATQLDIGSGDDDDDDDEERSDFADVGQATSAITQKYREIITMAMARLSPYRDDSRERKERASVANKTLSSIKSAIDVYLKTKAGGQDTSNAIIAIENLSNLSPNLGDEWKEEIAEVLRNLNGAIEMDDGFKEIKRDIADLQKVAKEDTRLVAPEGSLTPQEYRVALRLYGINDYPEKNTPQDPEIDEQGRKSKWAEAGYPLVGQKQIGKEQNIYLWTDVFETTDENGDPIPSVSSARITTVKRNAEFKIGDLARQLKQQIGEEFGYDSVDYQIISEFYVSYCRMIVEEAVPGSLKLIYG
jgi:hypothetical protein